MESRLYLTDSSRSLRSALRTQAFLCPRYNHLYSSAASRSHGSVLYLRFLRCGGFGRRVTDRFRFVRGIFGIGIAVRSVLIASVAGLSSVNILITGFWATMEGWLDANAWGSTVVLALLLLGGAYELVTGALKAV